MNYIGKVNKRIKEYYEVLEPSFPMWLNEYINTKELLKQQYISITCGTIYSSLFESKFFYSSLDHSIAVALIIWHFTHDKKQTLSGLFHDIATPVFKHCVDFLYGDYMNQEATEDLTTKIIENSKEIMNLLKKDNINLEDINDYHLYPIADNDTPKLSADRLEYSLSNALFTYDLCDLKKIKDLYEDIVINNNEEGIQELSFKSVDNALEFVKLTSKLSIIYREDRTRYSMQFIADLLKKLNYEDKILKADLYSMKEKEVIRIIEESSYSEVFNTWKKSKKVIVSKKEPKGVYYVHLKSKVRYIDPLVGEKRISKLSNIAFEMIQNNLSYNMDNYVYLNFSF